MNNTVKVAVKYFLKTNGLKIHEFIKQKFRTWAFCHQLIRENIFIYLNVLLSHTLFL